MRRFCWRERSEKLNWRLLGALDVADVVRRGDPSLLEQFALHITFARLPKTDPTTRDAWFLVRVLQLAMEFLLFVRARDGDVLDSLAREMRQLENERDELVLRAQQWEKRTRSGEKQVEKLHQVLQNIAKLLQIHGASPSAVATIETLLSELIVERRARQKKRKVEETGDEEEPAVKEARVCGFCGKLFSSGEYLEKHLVRRHGGERMQVVTLEKQKMRAFEREDDGDKENKGRNEEAGDVMQKMVQQVERALNDHEEKMRSLAEGEAAKVQRIYELLHAGTKQAVEMKVVRKKTEEEREERRQLNEVSELKQKAADELEDLKQQIQFLTLKKNMMGTAGLPANLPPRGDNALLAAESEIRDLQQTLEDVSRELASSRQELAKVQALHLSALKKKKELADKLASSREVPAVALQENSSQTEQPVVVNESVQTDEQVRQLQFEGETLAEPSAPTAFEDAGTDALILSYADVGIQTVELLQEPSVDGEVAIIDNPVPTPTATTDHVDPDLTSQESSRNGPEDQIEEVAPPQLDVLEEDDQIPDYIQQIHIQDILNAIIERAQSAASKASIETLQNPVSKDCSSISRHKYVRSRFQHGEDEVKERVASCLSQLEQFSRRFGVPAKSARLSDANMQIVLQALHGHLEVMPTDVLAKMVDRENTVNALIEKEWMPMEKTRQQALDRFKMEARAKSEISQGLVRQAMAAFGVASKLDQPSGALSSDGVTADAPANTDESSCESKWSENEAKKLPIDRDPEVPVVTSARRYSAKNTLTVVVEGEALREGTTYLAGELAESEITEGERANSPEVRETLDTLVENIHRGDEVSKLDENLPNVNPNFRSLEVSHDIPNAGESPLEAVAANVLSEGAELTESTETSLPRDSSSNSIRSITVGAVPGDMGLPSWETSALSRSRSEELSSPEPTSIEAYQVKPEQDNTEESRETEWQEVALEYRSQWHLPRVDSLTDLESPQPRPSVHSAIPRNRFEAANSPQPTSSLESDRLSVASDFELMQPMSRLDRTQSIVASSAMSFDIPSLGEESESVEASTSAVVMGLVDLVDRNDEADDHDGFSSLVDHPPAPVATSGVQHDSVLSFDDSDIEEVVLT